MCACRICIYYARLSVFHSVPLFFSTFRSCSWCCGFYSCVVAAVVVFMLLHFKRIRIKFYIFSIYDARYISSLIEKSNMITITQSMPNKRGELRKMWLLSFLRHFISFAVITFSILILMALIWWVKLTSHQCVCDIKIQLVNLDWPWCLSFRMQHSQFTWTKCIICTQKCIYIFTHYIYSYTYNQIVRYLFAVNVKCDVGSWIGFSHRTNGLEAIIDTNNFLIDLQSWLFFW